MWVLALAVSILSAALCLRYFARRGERLYVLVVVGTSWSIGFFMFLVLPFDLEHAYCRRCRYTSAHAAAPRGNETANDVIAWEDQPSDCHCLPHPGIEALPTLIPAAYRVTMLLGYLMNDLLRSYISSGEFTSRGRLRDALRECAFFYVPFTVVGVGFLVYLISRQGLTLTAVRMLVTGLFNAIGLFILVAFLGYGLVEVPRQLWHRADGIGQLRFLRFKVAVLSEELHEASRKLEEVIEAVHATDAALRAEAASASAQASLRLQAGMARIFRRCPPPQSRLAEPGGGLRPVPEPGGGAAGGAGRSRTHSRSNSLTSFIAGSSVCSATASVLPAGGSEQARHRSLVCLHVRLKAALETELAARGLYESYVRRGVRQEEAVGEEPGDGGGGGGRGGGGRGGGGGGGGGRGGARHESRWEEQQRRVAALALRAIALCCFALSGLVVWCEGTIMLSGHPFNLNLSPLSWSIYGLGGGGGISAAGGGLLPLALLYVMVVYCAWCTFFAMFHNCLYPLLRDRNSSPDNLLFNATYACRLCPPFCFNLLKLLHDEDELDKVCPSDAEADLDRFGASSACFETLSTFFGRTAFGTMGSSDLFEVEDTFSDYAPLLIVFLCGCTALHLGSSLLSCCGTCFACLRVPSFSFDDDFSDGRIDAGAQILAREKLALAAGSPLGANLQLLSGATSDEEVQRGVAMTAAGALRAAAPASSTAAAPRSSGPAKWRQVLDDGF